MYQKKHLLKRKIGMFLTAVALTVVPAVTSFAFDGEVYWDGASACWDEVEDADQYQVQLYRDGQQVASRTTRNSWYDFRDVMRKSGNYRFRVRERIDGDNGSWSSYSEYYRLDGTTAASPQKGSSGSGSGQKASNDTVQAVKNPSQDAINRVPVRMGWQQDGNGWWYQYADGSYAKNSWQNLDGKWYNFDEKGYLRTGWIFRDPIWFYSLPDGSMAIGWQQIDGKWYYFNEENGFWVPDAQRLEQQ